MQYVAVSTEQAEPSQNIVFALFHASCDHYFSGNPERSLERVGRVSSRLGCYISSKIFKKCSRFLLLCSCIQYSLGPLFIRLGARLCGAENIYMCVLVAAGVQCLGGGGTLFSILLHHLLSSPGFEVAGALHSY